MSSFLPPVSLSRPGKPTLEIWPRSNADMLLFLPGSMLGPGHYRLLLRNLWLAGLEVAAIHLSGHGKCKKNKNFTFSSLLEESIEAAHWLQAEYGKNLAICGHGQGGILALAHAGNHSSIKAAFPICAIFPQDDYSINLTRFFKFAKYRKSIMRSLKRLAAICPFLPIPLPVYLDLGKILSGKKKPVIVGNEKGRISYPLSYIHSLFSASLPRKCHYPLVLISAKNDALFTKELISRTFEHIEAPAKQIIWLQGGGHLAPFNPYWSKFIATQIACECANKGMKLEISGEIKWIMQA